MAVSLMGIPVADESKDSVMRKEADAFMARMSPVSYTHLTLPTTCDV